LDAVSLSIAGAAVGLAGLAAGAQLVRRRRRQGRDTALVERAIERKQNLPRSLHPVIDPDVCIGSLSCLRACPEGDILGIVRGAAALVHADHCIGHGRCAAECPVGAIRLVMGTEERGVDLPEVDAFFESSRPGVHVVGELGGMGLIKNAMEQGRQVASRLDAVLPRDRAGTDVAIVGAGPAGLAAALALRAAGRSFRILEQGAFGGSVANFPRQKVVMTEPVEIPHFGRLGRNTVSKEELLAAWQRAVARGAVRVEEGVRAEGLDGEDGRFVLQTTRGPVEARKVVLATGRRGSPRRLEVPGEELAKVSYGLGAHSFWWTRRIRRGTAGTGSRNSTRWQRRAA
jgi:ferredoxin